MNTPTLVQLLTNIQNDKGLYDPEFAHILGLKTRQAWQLIKSGKNDLSLPVLCRVVQNFPELWPEVQMWMRAYKNGKGQ